MKKTITAIILCIAMILSCVSLSLTSFAVGATYYVDSENGNDDNSGLTPDSAWKTLAKASEKTYSAGNEILFKAGGIYTGSFVAKGNGTADVPITVSSYGDTQADGLPMFYTNKDEALVVIHNVNGWTIENLEMSAPNGKGIHITADNEFGVMSDITVKGCTFHDIYYKNVSAYNECPDKMSPVYIGNFAKNTMLENITLSDLNIYNCGRGISTFGITAEWHRDIFVSPEVSYNRNFLFEDIIMNNILYDAIIVTSINGIVIRNSALLSTALLDNWCTAPMWSHHTKNMLVENCEIAGSTNEKDGMAVDFDGFTTDSTYQYIYSHDNARFIRNCLYDDTTKNANCTVRYCLSVNDRGENSLAESLKPSAFSYDYSINDDAPKKMDNFKFYNNTIINSGSFKMFELSNSYVANNIFYSDDINQTFATVHISMNEDGSRYLKEFEGEFTNNCFYGTAVPFRTENAILKNPLFVGEDLKDVNSFMLSKNSPLIGKGIQVEENMGEHDFYGNPLTETHNIGCYDGSGEDIEVKESFLSYITNLLKMIPGFFASIWRDIEEFFF